MTDPLFALRQSLTETCWARAGESWFVGLFPTLEGVGALRASTPPAAGRSTVVSHVHHLLFDLRIVLGRLEGRVGSADWSGEWAVYTLDEPGWQALLEDAQQAYTRLLEVLEAAPHWSEDQHLLAQQHTAHTAYHVGAIRQILLSVP